MEAITLERTYLVLKKSVPNLIHLTLPIDHLEKCRFKVFHSFPLPLHLRFTFFDEHNQPSVYQVLDILDGVPFDLFVVSSDEHKTFAKVELYSDVNALIHLRIDSIAEEPVNNCILN